MDQTYRIAGLRVRMDTYGRTLSQARPYREDFDGPPDITVIGHAQSLHAQQPHLSLDACEYLSTGTSFYRRLIDFDGLLLHASAVIVDGMAYAFTAPPGTGKSTHTALWCALLGNDRARILNDDKPALRREAGTWYAYGTPWSGTTDCSLNLRVPLGGICLLSRGDTNTIAPANGADAVHTLLSQTIRYRKSASALRLLALLDHLMTEVPIWQLYCTPTPEAALMSYEAMTHEAMTHEAMTHEAMTHEAQHRLPPKAN